MKVIGSFFKKEKFVGKKGDQERIVLIDSNGTESEEQFFELSGDGVKVVAGDMVEFSGRVAGYNNGRVRFWPVKDVHVVSNSASVKK